jgi:hypothetical protein
MRELVVGDYILYTCRSSYYYLHIGRVEGVTVDKDGDEHYTVCFSDKIEDRCSFGRDLPFYCKILKFEN